MIKWLEKLVKTLYEMVKVLPDIAEERLNKYKERQKEEDKK